MGKVYDVFDKEITLSDNFVSFFENNYIKITDDFCEQCLVMEFGLTKILDTDILLNCTNEQLSDSIMKNAKKLANEVEQELKTLEVSVSNIEVKIPPELLSDMKEYMGFQSYEDVIIFLKRTGDGLCACYENDNIPDEQLKIELLRYYEDTLETYTVAYEDINY